VAFYFVLPGASGTQVSDNEDDEDEEDEEDEDEDDEEDEEDEDEVDEENEEDEEDEENDDAEDEVRTEDNELIVITSPITMSRRVRQITTLCELPLLPARTNSAFGLVETTRKWVSGHSRIPHIMT
jgi:TATA-binding protein-associated factor Taf7